MLDEFEEELETFDRMKAGYVLSWKKVPDALPAVVLSFFDIIAPQDIKDNLKEATSEFTTAKYLSKTSRFS